MLSNTTRMIDPREMLTRRHFQMMLITAFLLHVVAVYGWYMMPKPPVLDIPVRALNIKLSDGELLTDEEISVMQPSMANTTAVEDTISQLVQNQKAMTAETDKALRVPDNSNAAMLRDPKRKYSAIAKQFVRELGAAMKPGAKLQGNSTAKNAEIMSRYEQMISLWIEKFKVFPEEARAKGLSGATMVRIRIDRRGNVRYYSLERSTGHQPLDRAAIEMIRRANPVPAVPNEYPPGDLLEFLIPVNFQLQ